MPAQIAYSRGRWHVAWMTSVLLVGILSRVAPAAPFDARNVGADAKFVVFVDMDAERKTALGQASIAQMVADPEYAQFEQDLTEWAGFTPSTDINDITVYGSSFSAQPDAIVVHANFDAATLASILVLLPASRTETYADHTVISWRDGITDKRVFATLYDARTIVLCSEATKLARVIDMLIDPSKSLEAVKTFPRPSQPDVKAMERADDRKADAANGWLFIGAVGVGAAPAFTGNMVLSKVDVATFKVSEVDGKTIARATCTTANARAGERLFEFASGIKTAGVLLGCLRGIPADAPAVAGILGQIAAMAELTCDEANVNATFAVDNKYGVELLDQLVKLEKRQNESTAGP